LWPARRVEEKAAPLAKQIVRALAARRYAEVAKKVDARGVCVRHQFGGCTHLSVEQLRDCGSDATRAYEAGSRSELTCRELMSGYVVKPHFTKAEARRPACELAPAYVPGTTEEDAPPRVLVQLLASRPDQPSFPWDAVTVGFEERDDELVVVEIAGSHWTP
jgi:hypothetical protein